MRCCLAIALICALLNPASADETYVPWNVSDPRFGGLSALELDRSGQTFVALSDTGFVFEGRLNRDVRGDLHGVQLSKTHPMVLENGSATGAKRARDTESLAIAAGGTRYISLEGRHRILRFAPGQTVPDVLAVPILKGISGNAGFEALAVDENGALFILPEASGAWRTPFPIFKRDPSGAWRRVSALPRSGGFRPVGADFGPDGALYILSRAFSGFAFAARVDKITKLGTPDETITRVFSSGFGAYDNLEGVAVWRDGADKTRLTLISDDNFSRFQTTHFLEVTLE